MHIRFQDEPNHQYDYTDQENQEKVQARNHHIDLYDDKDLNMKISNKELQKIKIKAKEEAEKKYSKKKK